MNVRILIFLIFIASAFADSHDPGFWAELQGKFYYGFADGFFQVPSGGKPTSTSKHRPQLDEMGIDQAVMFGLQVSGGWKGHGFFGEIRFVRFSENFTVDETLVSWDKTFTARTRLNGKARLDFTRFGYCYMFSLYKSPNISWNFVPLVNPAILDFDYRLESSSQIAKRSYRRISFQIGLDNSLRLDDFTFRFYFVGSFLTWYMISTEITAGYTFYREYHVSSTFYIGVSYDRIDYEDDQDMPNRIKVELGPALVSGIRIKF